MNTICKNTNDNFLNLDDDVEGGRRINTFFEWTQGRGETHTRDTIKARDGGRAEDRVAVAPAGAVGGKT